MTRRIIFLFSSTLLWGTSFFVSVFGGVNPAVGLLAISAWLLGFLVFSKNKLLLAIALLTGLLSTCLPAVECYRSLYNVFEVRHLTSAQSDILWASAMGLSVLALLLSVSIILAKDVKGPTPNETQEFPVRAR